MASALSVAGAFGEHRQRQHRTIQECLGEEFLKHLHGALLFEPVQRPVAIGRRQIAAQQHQEGDDVKAGELGQQHRHAGAEADVAPGEAVVGAVQLGEDPFGGGADERGRHEKHQVAAPRLDIDVQAEALHRKRQRRGYGVRAGRGGEEQVHDRCHDSIDTESGEQTRGQRPEAAGDGGGGGALLLQPRHQPRIHQKTAPPSPRAPVADTASSAVPARLVLAAWATHTSSRSASPPPNWPSRRPTWRR
eukprot:ctg_1175.g375